MKGSQWLDGATTGCRWLGVICVWIWGIPRQGCWSLVWAPFFSLPWCLVGEQCKQDNYFLIHHILCDMLYGCIYSNEKSVFWTHTHKTTSCLSFTYIKYIGNIRCQYWIPPEWFVSFSVQIVDISYSIRNSFKNYLGEWTCPRERWVGLKMVFV